MYWVSLILFGWLLLIWHSVSWEEECCDIEAPFPPSSPPPFSLCLSLADIPKQQFVTSAQANVQPLYPCGDREWLYIEHDDRKMENFLRSTFSDLAVHEAFRFIVEEADLYRYAVINHYGGLYTDSDCRCQHPVAEWMQIMGLDHIESGNSSEYILENVLHRMTVPLGHIFGADATGKHTVSVSMVIGIEFYDVEHRSNNFGEGFQFVQWAFLSKARNPILSAVTDVVLQNIDVVPDEVDNIVDRTGPKAFTKGIVDFIEKHSLYDPAVSLFDYEQIDAAGQLIPLQHKDEILWLLVLPYRAFGYYGYHPDVVKETPRRQRFITHSFHGSWKKK